MSFVGRRRSTESGWTWSHPPVTSPTPPPPLLPPVAGAALLATLILVALLIAWLSGEGNAPMPATPTPTATTAPTSAPTPTPAPSPPPPSPLPTPSPAPTSVTDGAPPASLAAWDGRAWRLAPPLSDSEYAEGEAVPFLLTIAAVRPAETHFVTVRYDCQGFAFLTSYDRDRGSGPASAPDGPGDPVPDATLPIPDDPASTGDDGQDGSLTLWGGSFRGLTPIEPPSTCTRDKAFTVGLAPATETLHLLWAAQIAPGAADRGLPLRIEVLTAGRLLTFQIDPAGLRPAQP